MNLPFSISMAYLKNRKRQSIISVLGVAMGVAFFIAISAMMKGMQMYFIAKVIDVSPHIIMKDEYRTPPLQAIEQLYPDATVELHGLKPKEELRGIRSAEKIVDALANREGITVAPMLQGQAFLRYGGKDISTTLIGIEPERERQVSNLERDLQVGSLNDLLTTSNGILLGEGLAIKLGITRGAKLSVISPAGIIMKMKVVGIFRTGITTIDNMESYALLKKVQVLQDRENVINQIKMRLVDVDNAQEIATQIEHRYGYRTESWQETNANIFSIFVIQNGIMYSTVSAILIVAGFGIFNIISTVVNEKNRDIAILKSIGFSELDIRKIFLLQGITVGLIGTLLGWVLGFTLVQGLASLRFDLEGFVRSEGFILYRSVGQYLFGGMVALISSSVSAYLPARKAAALNPVEIIRGAA